MGLLSDMLSYWRRLYENLMQKYKSQGLFILESVFVVSESEGDTCFNWSGVISSDCDTKCYGGK